MKAQDYYNLVDKDNYYKTIDAICRMNNYSTPSDIIKDNILKNWAVNIASNDLICKIFNNGLTVSKNIVGVSHGIENFNQSYKNDIIDFTNRLRGALDSKYKDINYKYSQNHFCAYNVFDRIEDYFRLEGEFFNNEVIMPNGTKISKGTRIINVVRKLIKLVENDEIKECLESLLSRRSIGCQGVRYNKTLTLSIDPIDYFTASYNQCGWSSCFNMDGGEFKGSTLAMMQGGRSFIAYIDEGIIEDARKFKYHNKSWRTWICVDKGQIFIPINGYPFRSESFKKEIYNMAIPYLTDFNFYLNHDRNLTIRSDIAYNDYPTRTSSYYIHKDAEQYEEVYYLDIYDAIDFEGNQMYSSNDFIPVPYSYCDECGCDIWNEDDCYYSEYYGCDMCCDCFWNLHVEINYNTYAKEECYQDDEGEWHLRSTSED